MYVEEKKVTTVGNSLAVTIKPNAGFSVSKGDKVKVSYGKTKIIIEKGD